jgi:hypothetical protein
MKIRRILWAIVASVCSLTLIGADTSPFPAPSVVVYPLTGTGNTPADAGGNVALLLSTKLSDLGGLVLRPYTPGTARAQYLSAALAQNDDYYMTGYLTPVGSEVSMIIQVVSTQSGSVIYSISATVQTYADVVARAEELRSAILQHAGRGLPAVGSVSNATTPAPIASSGSLNLTRALGRHARGGAEPTPTSTSTSTPASTTTAAGAQTATRTIPTSTATATTVPTASPKPIPTPVPTAAPAATQRAPLGAPNGLVVDIDGDAAPDERLHAQAALAQVLDKAGFRGEVLHVSSTDAERNAATLCAANDGAAAFFTGSLSNGSDGTLLFSVTAQGCNGTPVSQTQSSQRIERRGGAMAAIDRAASADAVALAAAVASLKAPKTSP